MSALIVPTTDPSGVVGVEAPHAAAHSSDADDLPGFHRDLESLARSKCRCSDRPRLLGPALVQEFKAAQRP